MANCTNQPKSIFKDADDSVEIKEDIRNGDGEELATNGYTPGIDLRGERPDGQCTFKATAALVCVIAGTGTLGMPYAVSRTGWLGIVLIVLTLFMSTTTGIMLVKCLYVNTIVGAGTTIIVTFVVLGKSTDMHIHDAPITQGADHKVVSWSNIPASLASMTFAYGGNVVYPHVEHTMKKPKQWPIAVWSALSLCCVLYLVISISGYIAFGDHVTNPILDDLPRGVWSMMCNILMTIHVLLAAPILLTSLSTMIESLITKRWAKFEQGTNVKQFMKRFVVRTALCGCIGLVAGVIPFFGDMMDLLGALTTCLLVFVFPIFFFFMLGGMKTARWWQLLWYVFILAFGLVAMIMGSIDAIKALVQDFKDD
ncbi:hypothetical protein BGZ76_001194 [Entomortierella beljakovae]|nr:hypothetical protein BGZ76_001194 [Entomortierella beljakovae]